MRTSQTLQTIRIGRRRLTTVCAALALSGTLVLTPLVSAQESTPQASPSASPQASPASSQEAPTTTPLMAFDFDEFPAAPITVRLLRITLAPGANVPMHTHPGPEFDRVESGVLTAQSDGDASYVQDGGASPETLSSATVDLQENDWILYPAGAGMSLTNNGNDDLVILSAVFLPVGTDAPDSITYLDGQPSNDDFTGVSFTVLGDGLLSEFPAGAASVTVDRVDIPEGTDLPGSDYPALYSRIEGNLSFAVDSGNVQVTRTAKPGLQPNAIPNQQFTLETGDAAFFPSGVARSSRADESGSLSIFRVIVQPSSAMGAAPATISFTAPVESTPTADETATATPASTPTNGLSPDTEVTTITDGVNMRSEPSVDGDIVNEINSGIGLIILDGPEEADDYTWYQVQLAGEPEADWSIGWVADEFFAANDATPTPTATTASGTPGASGTPVAGDFAEGDSVVTSDDNVRIREEASTDSEPVDAFPIGTELLITGASEQADGYTWYPVEVVGNEEVTGWVASDFIEPSDDSGN